MRAFPVVIVWVLALALAWVVYRRYRLAGLRNAGRAAFWQGTQVFVRAPLAMLTASFVAEILPPQMISRVLGSETGVTGIVLGTLIGAVMPGGPLVSFPVVLLLLSGGAGVPQTMAFLTSWSIIAFQQLFAYELPLMGWRFAALRLVACAAAVPGTPMTTAGIVSLVWITACMPSSIAKAGAGSIAECEGDEEDEARNAAEPGNCAEPYADRDAEQHEGEDTPSEDQQKPVHEGLEHADPPDI